MADIELGIVVNDWSDASKQIGLRLVVSVKICVCVLVMREVSERERVCVCVLRGKKKKPYWEDRSSARLAGSRKDGHLGKGVWLWDPVGEGRRLAVILVPAFYGSCITAN